MSRKKVIFLIAAVLVAATAVLGLYLSDLKALPQASYFLFGEQPAPTVSDRVLVLSPHQDDETLGAGGYIINAVKAGALTQVIFATDGNKRGLKNERHQEAVRAVAKLGLSESQLDFYDFPDGDLGKHETELAQRLSLEIKNFQPTVVITTLPEDTHPDHATTGRVVAQLAANSRGWQAYYFLIHHSNYPDPIGYNTNEYLLPPLPLISVDYQWQTFLLTADDQQRKEAALREYKTQLSIKNPILRQLLFSFIRKNELFAHSLSE